MMKKILVLILCVLVYSALFAQSNKDKKTVFQLSFVPPLSTNGAYSHQYTNTVSLNLLVTRVRDNILKSKEQKNIQPTKGRSDSAEPNTIGFPKSNSCIVSCETMFLEKTI